MNKRIINIPESTEFDIEKWLELLKNTPFTIVNTETLWSVQDRITQLNIIDGREVGKLHDGHHSFDELYEFRKMYNAALFNEWAVTKLKSTTVKLPNGGEATYTYHPLFDGPMTKYNVHKSWKHEDGELCFGGGWFIVSAMLPTGLISNHYKAEDWDLFKVPEVEKALFKFDGHTPADVLQRLKDLK